MNAPVQPPLSVRTCPLQYRRFLYGTLSQGLPTRQLHNKSELGCSTGCELNGDVADAAHAFPISSLQATALGPSRNRLVAPTPSDRLLPLDSLRPNIPTRALQRRFFSSTRRSLQDADRTKLTHVSETGSAHMVSISDKTVTKRIATAICRVRFTDATAIRPDRKSVV